ncbi:MAG: DUF6304 family protein [Marinifilaceae bacterium]|jgi:hypothetical protein|nr:DUF6304 family protein [Marinifilaceae bacterium]
MKKYKTVYRDKFGSETSEMESNGSELKITLREINFTGRCFELLEGEKIESKFEYDNTANSENIGDLTNCEFEIKIPIKIWAGKIDAVDIKANIRIGNLDNYGVLLTMNSILYGDLKSKRHDFFEDALIEIQEQLPETATIQTCLSCKYSHYHPLGNSMFGGLFCFKANKAKANQIYDKESLLNLYEASQKDFIGIPVQETFDCSEHILITKNDFNYSNWNSDL